MTTSKTLRHTLSKDMCENYPSPEFLSRFPVGFVSIVASKPGTGKTWYMLYNLYTLSNSNNVGALVGDCSPVLIYDRVRRIGNHSNNENIYVYFLSEMQQGNYNIDLASIEGLQQTRRLITQAGLKLLYIDTLVSLMSADESSQKEVTPIMTGLIKIASETNCAIVINHHLRKTSGEKKSSSGLDEVIGSSVLTRLASQVYVLSRSTNDEITIECVKSWFTNEKTSTFRIISNAGLITMIEQNGAYVGGKTKSQTFIALVESKSKGEQFKFEDMIKAVPNLAMSTYRDIYKSLMAQNITKDLTPTEDLVNKVLERT